MEICEFTYHRPARLSEACELGRTLGPHGRYLAGGTELLADFKQRRDEALHVIALDGLSELRRVSLDGAVLRIGALATLNEVAEAEAVRLAFPALAEAVRTMAALQIRNRATIGGNFCGAVPSADTPPICIAGGATLALAGPEGERTTAAEDFFVGPRRTVLEAGEILAEIRIPAQPEHSGACYERFSLRRATALAVAGVAARVVLREGKVAEARIALGAVAPVPLLAVEAGRLLAGEAPDEEVLTRAARQAAAEARPIDDFRGSAAFRREIVETLAARALRGAIARARARAGGGGGAEETARGGPDR